jgi:hypothetical protein
VAHAYFPEVTAARQVPLPDTTTYRFATSVPPVLPWTRPRTVPCVLGSCAKTDIVLGALWAYDVQFLINLASVVLDRPVYSQVRLCLLGASPLTINPRGRSRVEVDECKILTCI